MSFKGFFIFDIEKAEWTGLEPLPYREHYQ